MKNEDEQRKAMRRDQLQLLTILVVIGAFIAFMSTYGNENWWSQRRSDATAAGDLDRLLDYADTSLAGYARTDAAVSAGILARTSGNRRGEVEARFVRLRDAAGDAEEASIYKAGLSALNGDLIHNVQCALLTRAVALVGRSKIEDRGWREGVYALPKLSRGEAVDIVIKTDLHLVCSAFDPKPDADIRRQNWLSVDRLSGLSSAEIKSFAARANRIGVSAGWNFIAGYYAGCKGGEAHQYAEDIFLVDLAAGTVIGAMTVLGSEPPHEIGVDVGQVYCGAVGDAPDITPWLVERR